MIVSCSPTNLFLMVNWDLESYLEFSLCDPTALSHYIHTASVCMNALGLGWMGQKAVINIPLLSVRQIALQWPPFEVTDCITCWREIQPSVPMDNPHLIHTLKHGSISPLCFSPSLTHMHTLTYTCTQSACFCCFCTPVTLSPTASPNCINIESKQQCL